MAVNKVYKDNSQYLVLVFFFVPSQEAQLLGCFMDDTYIHGNEMNANGTDGSHLRHPCLLAQVEF